MNTILLAITIANAFTLNNVCDLDDDPGACELRLRGVGVEPRGDWSCESTEDGPVCERPGKCFTEAELPDKWVPFCLVEVCGPVDGRTECWEEAE